MFDYLRFICELLCEHLVNGTEACVLGGCFSFVGLVRRWFACLLIMLLVYSTRLRIRCCYLLVSIFGCSGYDCGLLLRLDLVYSLLAVGILLLLVIFDCYDCLLFGFG